MIYDLPIEIDLDEIFDDLPQFISDAENDYRINYDTVYQIPMSDDITEDVNQHRLREWNNHLNCYCYILTIENDLYLTTIGTDGRNHSAWCLAWGITELDVALSIFFEAMALPLSLRLFDVDPPAFIPIKTVLEITEAYKKTLKWVSEDIRGQLDRSKNIGSAVCERWT